MKPEPKIVFQPLDVKNRLAKLGLTKELLLEVIFAAVGARNDCTTNEPRSAPGWRSWCDGNARLRQLLIPLGWEWNEDDNIPSVINRDLNMKITVSNTDAGTGLEYHRPQQTSKKGSSTERIVSRNQGMLGDILTRSRNAVTASHPGGIACWYLCIFCEDDEVRAELSCPVSCEDGYFKDFFERVFLIGLDDDGSGIKIQKPDPSGVEPDLEIPVTRKKSV